MGGGKHAVAAGQTFTRRRRFAFALGSLSSWWCGAGCGAADDPRAPATTWSYAIDFQSKDAAVAIDTLEISLFAASAGGCAALVSMRRGDEDLAPIAEASSVAVCDVFRSEGGTLSIPYQAVSVLVVAKKAGKEILIGCGEQTAAPSQREVPVVTLTNYDETISIQPSHCPTVAAYCAESC